MHPSCLGKTSWKLCKRQGLSGSFDRHEGLAQCGCGQDTCLAHISVRSCITTGTAPRKQSYHTGSAGLKSCYFVICQGGAAISSLILNTTSQHAGHDSLVSLTGAASTPALASSGVRVCRGLLGDSSSEEEEEDAAELAAESDQVRQSWLTCMMHLAQCLRVCWTVMKALSPESNGTTRKEKTTPFGVNSKRSPVLYWVAQNGTTNCA